MAYIVFNFAGFVMEYQFQSKLFLFLASVSSIVFRGGGFLAGILGIIYGSVMLLKKGNVELTKSVLNSGGEYVLLGVGVIIASYVIALVLTEALWRLEERV